MPRHTPRHAPRHAPRATPLGVAALALGVAACGGSTRRADLRAGGADSAFAALEARGAAPAGMGVDQRAATHRFDALADGGRITLQHDAGAPAEVAQIRRHLRHVAAAFTAGDFSTPGFVHAMPAGAVPGAAVMAARRASIVYAYRDVSRGGEVRVTTRDTAALAAVHAFLAFQRGDHRAGGHAHP